MPLNIINHSNAVKDFLVTANYSVQQTYCKNTIEELLAVYKSESNDSIVVNFENVEVGERNEQSKAYSKNEFQIYVLSKATSKETIPSVFFAKLDAVYDLIDSEFDIKYSDFEIDNYSGEYYYGILKIEIINL